jgi:enoyl-CoA hydratase/carnithine racemase
MVYETLLYESQGSIATITLNRPQRLNGADDKPSPDNVIVP